MKERIPAQIATRPIPICRFAQTKGVRSALSEKLPSQRPRPYRGGSFGNQGGCDEVRVAETRSKQPTDDKSNDDADDVLEHSAWRTSTVGKRAQQLGEMKK